MVRYVIISLLLVVVLLAAGVGIFAGLVASKARSASIEPQRPMLRVKGVRVEPVTVVVPLKGFGSARADRSAVLGSQVAGQVVELAADLREGVAVREGQLLVRIDDREYQAQFERARSLLAADTAAFEQIDVQQRNLEQLVETAADELAVAEREYSRVLALLEDQMSNPRELDAARVVLKRARRALQMLENELALLPKRRAQQRATCELRRAEMTLAELNLERCTIVAPFSGRIEELQVEVGEQVSPGRQLLSLLDPRLIEVPIELPVSKRGSVQEGALARLMLESNAQVVWTGRVARISPSADREVRTFSLFVEVVNPDPASDSASDQPPLMPGMFVRARIDGPTLKEVLLVPRGAVRQQRVFVCEDGKARRRDVQVQQHLLDRTVISGLRPGQVVITSNLDALYDGALVDPVLESSPAVPALAADDLVRPPAQTDSRSKTP